MAQWAGDTVGDEMQGRFVSLDRGSNGMRCAGCGRNNVLWSVTVGLVTSEVKLTPDAAIAALELEQEQEAVWHLNSSIENTRNKRILLQVSAALNRR